MLAPFRLDEASSGFENCIILLLETRLRNVDTRLILSNEPPPTPPPSWPVTAGQFTSLASSSQIAREDTQLRHATNIQG